MTPASRLTFEQYVAVHGAALQRYAYVLSGDQQQTDDLVQAALLKALGRWHRIGRMAAPHAYVRRIVTHEFLDRHRRGSSRERSVGDVPDTVDIGDPLGRAIDQDAIGRGLDCLTPRQRSVVVLRYFLDLSDEAIADDLGCSPESVRSHASRALQRLRGHLTYPDLEIRP